MRCPKCYGKIVKEQTRCGTCGFNLALLEEGSNKEAKKALKGIYKDDVMFTTKIPLDVKKKKLLLFAIFLGLFGVHDFYVGKLYQGLYICICTTVTFILSSLVTALGIITANNAIYIAYQFVLVFQGIAVLMWIADIFKIALERYKIPVYNEKFSKHK